MKECMNEFYMLKKFLQMIQFFVFFDVFSGNITKSDTVSVFMWPLMHFFCCRYMAISIVLSTSHYNKTLSYPIVTIITITLTMNLF